MEFQSGFENEEKIEYQEPFRQYKEPFRLIQSEISATNDDRIVRPHQEFLESTGISSIPCQNERHYGLEVLPLQEYNYAPSYAFPYGDQFYGSVVEGNDWTSLYGLSREISPPVSFSTSDNDSGTPKIETPLKTYKGSILKTSKLEHRRNEDSRELKGIDTDIERHESDKKLDANLNESRETLESIDEMIFGNRSNTDRDHVDVIKNMSFDEMAIDENIPDMDDLENEVLPRTIVNQTEIEFHETSETIGKVNETFTGLQVDDKVIETSTVLSIAEKIYQAKPKELEETTSYNENGPKNYTESDDLFEPLQDNFTSTTDPPKNTTASLQKLTIYEDKYETVPDNTHQNKTVSNNPNENIMNDEPSILSNIRPLMGNKISKDKFTKINRFNSYEEILNRLNNYSTEKPSTVTGKVIIPIIEEADPIKTHENAINQETILSQSNNTPTEPFKTPNDQVHSKEKPTKLLDSTGVISARPNTGSKLPTIISENQPVLSNTHQQIRPCPLSVKPEFYNKVLVVPYRITYNFEMPVPRQYHSDYQKCDCPYWPFAS